MKIKSIPLGITILVILFGGIFFTTLMNWWQTTNTKVPETFQTGDFAGQANPADIRGSYYLADITKAFNVPSEDLKKAFAIPAETDSASFQVKQLEAIYASAAAAGTEVGTGSVRLFVALYAGLPFEIVEGTYMPAPAVEILKQRGQLTPEQAAYLDAHTITIP
jgi:hypothetical protein